MTVDLHQAVNQTVAFDIKAAALNSEDSLSVNKGDQYSFIHTTLNYYHHGKFKQSEQR